MSAIYVAGKRVRPDPARALGKGGEADVFDLGHGHALKLFKAPDHPDFDGLPLEQQAAAARIELQQRKLPAFPKGLPAAVVAPEALATDKSGHIVGYTMPVVAGAEALRRYADPTFHRAGVTSTAVVSLFRAIGQVLADLHRHQIVVGDCNDLNILVTSAPVAPYLIDADSFQFGAYPCTVFTERFVDPLLCDPAAASLLLVRPYTPNADWYAFNALLMQSLLCVGPYGGVFRPKQACDRVPHNARPLHRITVFHPEVQYPKPATPYRVLPDELLHHFHNVFCDDERGPFPTGLLDSLQFRTCTSCGTEHARLFCPICAPVGASAAPLPLVRVRGEVVCRHLVEVRGALLEASCADGQLRYLYHEDGAFHREDGSVVLRGELDPALRFHLLGDTTVVGRDCEAVLLHRDGSHERLAADSAGPALGPALAANGRSLFIGQGGRLLRRDAALLGGFACFEPLGELLENQTRFWTGDSFGLGFYRAGDLAVAFSFDCSRRGINDTLPLPKLNGQLVAAACAIDDRRAWLFLALSHGGRTRNLCLCYSRTGVLEGSVEASDGDGSWLGSLRGKCAIGGVLLAATDDGIVRVEPDAGGLCVTRVFPDTEPFVDGDAALLAGRDGLYVVGQRRITLVTLTQTSRKGAQP